MQQEAVDGMVIKQAMLQVKEAEELTNSLSSLVSMIQNGPGGQVGCSEQISQTNTLFDNNRWYLISNLRQLLAQLYVEHGLVQTLIDQPVEDAFRAGFEIKTGQLNADEVEELMVYCEKNHVITEIKQGIIWARLFGGGAIMVITDQDPMNPLDLKRIRPNTPLEFRGIDMWELYFSVQNTASGIVPGTALGSNLGDFYDYYGHEVHQSRVFKIMGKTAPSFIRPRLRGWGLSELEKLVRSLNQYMKNQDVIFELLDEAKVDVFKMKGYNSGLLNKAGTAGVAKRIQAANLMKNYNHALTMDAEDDYIQKQITFTGLAEVLTQIRQGIACDMKMPITKLFGVSSAGFNSGEDDIENYNSTVESEVRGKNKWIVVDTLSICCQKLFGFIPTDMQITWKPLRILNAKDEEEVKNHKFNRSNAAYDRGLASPQETKEAYNRDSLLPVEVDEESEALPPPMAPGGEDVKTGSGGEEGKSLKVG